MTMPRATRSSPETAGAAALIDGRQLVASDLAFEAVSELQVARSCYDHVAGRLGVGLTEALMRRGAIVLDGTSDYRVTRSGHAFFAELGVDLTEARAKKRHFARQCLDWTEHRPHVAGALGAALRSCLFERDWIRRTQSRTLRITEAGRKALKEEFAIEV